jgi:hypothetical protein
MSRLHLEILGVEERGRWDELIASFPSRSLFHRQVWLDYLAACRGVQIGQWAIQEGDRRVGFFCGGLLRKGPFRVFGSPLRGWITNDMGPISNGDLDQRAFLEAVDELAARERWAMFEVENPKLSEDLLVEFGYEPVPMPVYIVELTPEDPAKMMARIHPKARKAIRLAKQFGLTVEDSNDPAIVAEMYDQYREILSRKKLTPTFDPICPRLVFELLKSRDMLFALGVRDPEGRLIATGFFPHDDQTVYFMFTGSRVAYWDLFPNDFLQWKAMEMAAARGLRTYNMCGYGRFKSKYGGVLEPRKRWHKCYWRSARWARHGYEMYSHQRLGLEGWWRRIQAKYTVAIGQ